MHKVKGTVKSQVNQGEVKHKKALSQTFETQDIYYREKCSITHPKRGKQEAVLVSAVMLLQFPERILMRVRYDKSKRSAGDLFWVVN
jgi:hypothetical protein